MRFGKTKPRTEYFATGNEVAIRFAEIMLPRLEAMKNSEWKQGWIGGNGGGVVGFPQNISGRNYSGSNSFFLQMDQAMKGYELPVWLTFNQAKNFDSSVLKGEKAVPVMYSDILIKDEKGKRVSYDTFKMLSKEEQAKLDIVRFVKSFAVFNVDQTDFALKQPEKFEELRAKFAQPQLRDTQGMYTHPAIDRMIETNGWVCPIQADKEVPGAFYSISKDIVVCPMKNQFNTGTTPDEVFRNGQEFVGTLLHEMTHSTLTPERLNRKAGKSMNDRDYAREEIVAEMTSAMICHGFGFDKKITDNSAAYLDAWIEQLKENPRFILSVMSDVNKAAEMILDRIDKMQISLGEMPYLAKNDPLYVSAMEEVCPFQSVDVIKNRDDSYSARVSYQNEDLGFKEIPSGYAKQYYRIPDMREKHKFIGPILKDYFADEIKRINSRQKEECVASMKI